MSYQTLTYKSWAMMKTRCLNPNYSQYKDYGGRGITVCKEWMTYCNFLADMGERPAGYTLERIDNNGNYEPCNCMWATVKEQRNNSRQNRYIEYNGETHTVAQWSEITGINRNTIIKRLNMGWSSSKTFDTSRPKQRQRRSRLGYFI